MSDITKCQGTKCPVKEHCKRFTATPNEHWQAYFSKPPLKKGKCDMFWGDNAESIWKQLKEITKTD